MKRNLFLLVVVCVAMIASGCCCSSTKQAGAAPKVSGKVYSENLAAHHLAHEQPGWTIVLPGERL